MDNKCWSSKIELLKYLKEKLGNMTNDPSAYIGIMRQGLLRLKAVCTNHKVHYAWEEHLPKAA